LAFTLKLTFPCVCDMVLMNRQVICGAQPSARDKVRKEVLQPFREEQQYLEKLRQSNSVEQILLCLFNLLNVDDYRSLFYASVSENSGCGSKTVQWIIQFAQLCSRRYFEFDDLLSQQYQKSIHATAISQQQHHSFIIENKLNQLIEDLKQCFELRYFSKIIQELEFIVKGKIEKILEILNEYDKMDNTNYSPVNEDVVHVPSTTLKSNRSTYAPYKHPFMLHVNSELHIRKHVSQDSTQQQYSERGIVNKFVGDLPNAQTISIKDPDTNLVYDIPTKYLYFAKPCDANAIIPPKYRACVLDKTLSVPIHRYGFIAEPPSTSNGFRCLVFYDDSNISSKYHLSQEIYLCLDQNLSQHLQECKQHLSKLAYDFLERYFQSYPERTMLRTKIGQTIKVKNILTPGLSTPAKKQSYQTAKVDHIDSSMMTVQFQSSGQKLSLYRGSILFEQLNHYYSKQYQQAPSRHSARQHLSTRRSNAPEIICLNDSIRGNVAPLRQPTLQKYYSSSSSTSSNDQLSTPRQSPVKLQNDLKSKVTHSNDETETIPEKRPRLSCDHTDNDDHKKPLSRLRPRQNQTNNPATNSSDIADGFRLLQVQDLPATSSTIPVAASSSTYQRYESEPSLGASTTTVHQQIIQTNGHHHHHHTLQSKNICVNPMFTELAKQFQQNNAVIYTKHVCSSTCVELAEREYDKYLKINPFLKPFACHWTMIEPFRLKKSGDVTVRPSSTPYLYCTPCGKILRDLSQVDNYLYVTESKLTTDLFIYDRTTNIQLHYIHNGFEITDDLSKGKENSPITVVNEVDHAKIGPKEFVYSVERIPTTGVNLQINNEKMTCCDCKDSCRDRAKCACWLRTLKYAELAGEERVKAMKQKNKTQAEILNAIGYKYRRLVKNLSSGIYECNDRCQCHNKSCTNRVVQNGIAVQLQLFKTFDRGWGVRCLHDVPRGTFISVYSGEILTSEQADSRGKTLGDEYQADLDFFEHFNSSDNDDDDSRSTHECDDELDEETNDNNEDIPEIITTTTVSNGNDESEQNWLNDDTSTSSTESVNSRLRSAQLNLRARDLIRKGTTGALATTTTTTITTTVSKNKKKSTTTKSSTACSISLNRSKLPDYDGIVYTLDAKLIGNIGRYFNHSCSPNLEVQNVFVDTHDIHFPWIGFFATKFIKSGTELCWDYRYEVGTIPNRRIDCTCGSTECRGRLL
ncbi:unnamed protein product, partial [Didymodactylos carnosus]